MRGSNVQLARTMNMQKAPAGAFCLPGNSAQDAVPPTVIASMRKVG